MDRDGGRERGRDTCSVAFLARKKRNSKCRTKFAVPARDAGSERGTSGMAASRPLEATLNSD